MAYFIYTNLLFVVIFVAHGTDGMSEEFKNDLQEKYTPIIMECAIEYNIDPEIKDMRKLDKLENACFFACTLKRTGIFDDKGMLVELAAKESSHLFVDTEDEKWKLEAAITSCTSVNKEFVTDGDRGCNRALLLFKCLRGQAELLGLDACRYHLHLTGPTAERRLR